MTKKVSNIAASVRQRLLDLDLARSRGDEFQLIITKYALERLLYRLTISPYRNSFVLKGAMLFSLWTEEAYRATRDLDLLGSGDPSIKRLETIFRIMLTGETMKRIPYTKFLYTIWQTTGSCLETES